MDVQLGGPEYIKEGRSRGVVCWKGLVRGGGTGGMKGGRVLLQPLKGDQLPFLTTAYILFLCSLSALATLLFAQGNAHNGAAWPKSIAIVASMAASQRRATPRRTPANKYHMAAINSRLHHPASLISIAAHLHTSATPLRRSTSTLLVCNALNDDREDEKEEQREKPSHQKSRRHQGSNAHCAQYGRRHGRLFACLSPGKQKGSKRC